MSDAERVAQRFHETYERLAPAFGYETREASAKPWAEVPDQNRQLMWVDEGTDNHLVRHIVPYDALVASDRIVRVEHFSAPGLGREELIMEATGTSAYRNSYVQQLLDRAANLVQASAEEQDTDRTEHEQWLREYHQEKARFGQPEGSPAYAETRGEAADDEDLIGDDGNPRRGARDASADNRERREGTASDPSSARRQAPRAKKTT